MKLTPDELRGIPFPKCYGKCKPVEHFGVCECEAFCPEKFTKLGEPLNKGKCNVCACAWSESEKINRDLEYCSICGGIIIAQR